MSDRTDDSALQQRIRPLETRWQQVLDKFSVYYHLSVHVPSPSENTLAVDTALGGR